MTELDTGQRASGPPSAKLRSVGNYSNFAVVDIDNEVPVFKYNVEPPERELTSTGKEKVAVRLTVMALDGVDPATGAAIPPDWVVKDGEVDKPVAAGDVVSIFIGGYAKYDPDNDKVTDENGHVSWGCALDRLAATGEKFRVGVVGQQAFLRTIPSPKNPDNPRKDRKFKLRAATAEEAAQTQRCEAIRAELQQQQTPPTELASAAPQAPAANFGQM